MLDRVSFDGEVFAGGRMETKMKQFIAHPGDLVVSKIRARQGSIGIVQPESGRVSVTIHYRVLKPDGKRVDVTYAWLALRSSYCRTQFLAATGGAMKGEIGEEALLAIMLPLPPLAEQRAIVERWRAAQAQIAAASVRVEKLKARFEADFLTALGFKLLDQQSVPKVFTADWKDVERWSVGFNQQVLTSLDLSTGKFPSVTLGSITSLLQYGTSEKANVHGKGFAVLRMNNIKDGELALTDIKHIELPQREADKLQLKKGDILFNRTNSKELVGKCAVFHEETPWVFASYLIRVRLDEQRACPDFVTFVLNGRIGRQQIDALSRQIIGQANINSEEIRSLRIPFPPLEVQRKLVERVTAARAQIARERAAAAKLNQSIAAEVESLVLGMKPLPRS